MSNNPYKDGKKAYGSGYCYNPYINSVNRDEWQRGYDDAMEEDNRVKNEYAQRLDDLWNVPDRAKEAYIAMEDNFGPSTVLDFMLAMQSE